MLSNDETKKFISVIFVVCFLQVIGGHLLALFCPRWMATAVAYFICWGPASYYVLRMRFTVSRALLCSLSTATVGAAIVAMPIPW